MPIFEYRCGPCNVEFEEVLTSQDDIRDYKDAHPCPGCQQMAPRAGISVTNFNFAGGVRGESGVHGQSGSHDLDYPTLDKAIGRSSAKRWERINREQAARDQVRKETGAMSLSKTVTKRETTFAPADGESLKTRQMGLARYLVEKRKAGD